MGAVPMPGGAARGAEHGERAAGDWAPARPGGTGSSALRDSDPGACVTVGGPRQGMF